MQVSFNKLVRDRWFLLLVTAIGAALLHPLAYFFLLALPFLFAVRVTRRNALVSVPVVFALNVVATMINAVLLDTFNIPVVQSLLVLLAAAEAALLIRFKPKRIDFEVKQSSLKYLYIVYGLFVLAIIARVISVLHLEAPILHDPMAHAFWAKRIATEQAIDYFYSPGLHIWTWLASDAFGVSLARSVHITTNFFSAFSVLAWALAAYVFTQKGRLAMWTGLMLLIVPIPQFLYFMAGKNSFVMATGFIAITAIFTLLYYQKRNWLNFLLLTTCLVGVGLIHYPAYAYVTGFVILYLLWNFLSNDFHSLTKRMGKLIVLLAPVILSLAIVWTNVLLTTSENIEVEKVSSQSAAEAYHYKINGTGTMPDESVLSQPDSEDNATHINSPFAAVKRLKSEYLAFSKSLPSDIGVISNGALVVGLFFLIASTSRNKNDRRYRNLIWALILANVLIYLALAIYPISSLKTTRDTGLLLLPLILSLPLAALFSSITNKKRVGFLIVIVLALTASTATLGVFRAKSNEAMVVDEYDVAAFAWINENIGDEQKFINRAKLDPGRATVLHPKDGALWIPIITDNKLAVPFHELGFLSVNSHVNYEYTRKLSSKNTQEVVSAVKHFKNSSHDFLYVDGDQAYSELSISYLTSNGLATVEYENKQVKVVKLLPAPN